MRIARKIVIGWEFYQDWALRGGVFGDNTSGCISKTGQKFSKIDNIYAKKLYLFCGIFENSFV